GFTVAYEGNHLFINDREILVSNESEPTDINWGKRDVKVVIDSSGKFRTKQLLKKHLTSGVDKVILSCPPDDDSIDRTVVMGVNHETILPDDKIISNASCTTNCVALLLKVLMNEFGIKKAFMNTVHPLTNNQNIQDGFHKDFRRARASINNIIPTTTSAIGAIELIMPELKNSFDGFATRVPVADCSFAELTILLNQNTSVNKINEAFKYYSENILKSYLEYCTDPIVSRDVNGNPHSAVYDSLATKMIGSDFVQLLGWYDNEYGYSSRIIDLIKYLYKS
ncbi:MAG: type I glyceraldehyde-3-phosphate dehydrogenase, partial [Candidatus Cloacimonetes bacterium]|nr:type I glyceraldehyde-3-phosphate dehydrogenase [Candidatus Cloacimonadota bacterium]